MHSACIHKQYALTNIIYRYKMPFVPFFVKMSDGLIRILAGSCPVGSQSKSISCIHTLTCTHSFSSDIQKIEAGIGEKLSVVIQSFTTFFAAFVVSFTQEWRLTLAMLAYTPIILFVTMILGKVYLTNAHTHITKYTIVQKNKVVCI